jgi:general secretion pathway protein J
MTRTAGFTLLEILVVLVVYGFIMVGLTQGVQFGLHARAMQARTIDTRSDLDTTDRVLRNLIEQMDPGTNDRSAVVIGSTHTLVFTTTLPAEDAQPIEAALAVDATHQLMIRWTPHPHATRLGPTPQPRESLLLANVDHLDFAYWEPSGQWVETWHGSPPPMLVRIRIVFRKDDRRRWPEIIVAPMRHPFGT